MTINIDDYISEAEKKDIAREVFRDECLDKYNSSHSLNEILFSNAAYEVVRKMVDENVDKEQNLDDIIMSHVLRIISELSKFDLFRASSERWDKDISTSQQILDKCVQDNQSLIHDKVVELINELGKDDLRCTLSDAMEYNLYDIFKDAKNK